MTDQYKSPTLRVLASNDFTLIGAVISYPHLFTAKRAGRPGRESGVPRFTADFILSPDTTQADHQWLNYLWQQAISTKWPAGMTGLPECFAIQQGSPWKDPTNKGANPQFQGRLRLAASAQEKSPPQVLKRGPQGTFVHIENQADIFAGCIVQANLRFFGYENTGTGISCGLNMVLLEDNTNVDRLDSRVSADDAFEAPAGAPTPLAPGATNHGPALPAGSAVSMPGAPVATPPGAPGGPPGGGMSFLD